MVGGYITNMCIPCRAAEYTFPESRPVTDACKDLLRRILVVDPAKRITISAIQVPAGRRALGLV